METWSGYTGSTLDQNNQQKYYANPALWFYNNYGPNLSNVRFSYVANAAKGRPLLTKEVAADWAQFLSIVSNPDVRNLYIGTHASRMAIGPISTALIHQFVMHRYHFIFLDGCESDNNALAFGFEKAELEPKDIDFYQGTGLPRPRHLRPAGGVGFYTGFEWYKEYQQPNTYIGYIPPEFAQFYINFQPHWTSYGWGVEAAVQYAALQAINLNPAPLVGLGPWDVVRILGYRNLHHNEFNEYSSTWW